MTVIFNCAVPPRSFHVGSALAVRPNTGLRSAFEGKWDKKWEKWGKKSKRKWAKWGKNRQNGVIKAKGKTARKWG